MFAATPLAATPLAAGPLSSAPPGPVAVVLTGAVTRVVARAPAGSMTVRVEVSGSATLHPVVYGRLFEAAIFSGTARPRAKVLGTLQQPVSIIGAVQPKPQAFGLFGGEQVMSGAVVRSIARAVSGVLGVSTVFAGSVHHRPVVSGSLTRGVAMSGQSRPKPRTAGAFVYTSPPVNSAPDVFIGGRVLNKPSAAGVLRLCTGLTGQARPRPVVNGTLGSPLAGAIPLMPAIAGRLAIDWQDDAEGLWVCVRQMAVAIRQERQSLYVR